MYAPASSPRVNDITSASQFFLTPARAESFSRHESSSQNGVKIFRVCRVGVKRLTRLTDERALFGTFTPSSSPRDTRA
jgi:hypothetical protein